MATKEDENGQVEQLAASLDCMTEEELLLLAKIKRPTAEAWRKRGLGPAYVLLGNRFLYPKKAVAAYLATLVRERQSSPIGGAL